jgi:hypothetical protein
VVAARRSDAPDAEPRLNRTGLLDGRYACRQVRSIRKCSGEARRRFNCYSPLRSAAVIGGERSSRNLPLILAIATAKPGIGRGSTTACTSSLARRIELLIEAGTSGGRRKRGTNQRCEQQRRGGNLACAGGSEHFFYCPLPFDDCLAWFHTRSLAWFMVTCQIGPGSPADQRPPPDGCGPAWLPTAPGRGDSPIADSAPRGSHGSPGRS